MLVPVILQISAKCNTLRLQPGASFRAQSYFAEVAFLAHLRAWNVNTNLPHLLVRRGSAICLLAKSAC